MKSCPECGGKNTLRIKYWRCNDCNAVFMRGDDNWISVEDRLPENEGNYIVAEYWFAYDHTDVRQRTYGGKDYGWYYSDEEGDYERYLQGYKMIAWQPLPLPPERRSE